MPGYVSASNAILKPIIYWPLNVRLNKITSEETKYNVIGLMLNKVEDNIKRILKNIKMRQ